MTAQEQLTRFKSLTDKEREAFDLMCEGWTTPEIAERLYVSPGTAHKRLRGTFEKLGAPTGDARIDLRVWAVRNYSHLSAVPSGPGSVKGHCPACRVEVWLVLESLRPGFGGCAECGRAIEEHFWTLFPHTFQEREPVLTAAADRESSAGIIRPGLGTPAPTTS